MTAERKRLEQARTEKIPWRKWGPYLSERQWGTVREDYSPNGTAWEYFSHDQARSRAYRWGEDGLAGLSDDKTRLCLAVALWNGADPILKERLFGLTNAEGNHGEDVKEYYFYLDCTPTHSYMRYLYKYPQSPFPYDELVRINREHGRKALEYELLDTGVFDEDRYFDIFVEYAKGSPEDILVKIDICNRGPETASLNVLPTLWFRNTWSWSEGAARPTLRRADAPRGASAVMAAHPSLGERWFYAEGNVPLLFTENETNAERLFQSKNRTPYVKDAFHRYLVEGRTDAVNPEERGTKSAALYRLDVGPGGTATIRCRLTEASPAALAKLDPQKGADPFGPRFEEMIALRLGEADAFYAAITPASVGPDAKRVMRQAFAGMLWSKQHYCFDVDRWLEEHGAHPLSPGAAQGSRNQNWFHMLNDDVISMPDKWEYPWYAAWDLAFHTIALAVVDLDFAKQQLELVLGDHYLHPSGQIPAYEWNFGDVNPPVHAMAALMIYEGEKVQRGKGDLGFLKHVFQKLVVNFTWWVNRKDPAGKNVFEGGFLGLDNIGVFDRSAPLPTGGRLEQADGTAWMALFSQNMLAIALELSIHDRAYEEMAVKFGQHFMWIAAAMDRIGVNQDEMWDEEDGFFYDLLSLPDGWTQRMKVRSMVGLLPLCATTVMTPQGAFSHLARRFQAFLERRPYLTANIAPIDRAGVADRRLLAILNEDKLRRVLGRMLDEDEFLSPHGIRSLSRYHKDHPYTISVGDTVWSVDYEPAESTSGSFGGNSNWRGPVWVPVNILIIRALLNLYSYYGDGFQVECPTGSGSRMNLFQVAEEISNRIIRIFLRDEQGRRPVYGGATKFQTDPHWREHILFYEYFHGDNGAGLGASHQTGWTGDVACLIQLFAGTDAKRVLEEGVRVHLPDDKP